MAVKTQKSRISWGSGATFLVAATLLGQLIGFLRTRLLATNFPVGSTDAFFVAFQIPDFFFYTIAAGALGVAFIPILADRFQVGDKKAMWALTNSLLNILAIVMAAVGVILFVFAGQLIHVLAPDLPQEGFNQAVAIMRIIAFNPLLFTLSGVITSVQQTIGRFFFFAVAPMVYNLAIIAALYILGGSMGIVGLGVGALIGAILQLVVAWAGMWGLGYRYKPTIKWRSEDFRTVMHNLPARSLDQGIDQVNSVVETNRAQALATGPVSHYNYALTLQNVPILLIGNAVATAAFPRLTARLAQNRRDLFRKDFLNILRVLIWLAVPVTIASYFGRGYLARMIFGDNSPEVALIFGYLTISIFFRIIYAMISRWFYAQKDTRTPLYVSVLAIGLNIYLAFALARPQSEGGYDIAGLALAQSIVALVEVTILTAIMIMRDPKMLDRMFIAALFKIVSVSGFTILAAYVMVQLLPLSLTDRGILTLGFKTAAIFGVIFFVHAGVSWVFGLREVEPVLRKLRHLILKPVRFIG